MDSRATPAAAPRRLARAAVFLSGVVLGASASCAEPASHDAPPVAAARDGGGADPLPPGPMPPPPSGDAGDGATVGAADAGYDAAAAPPPSGWARYTIAPGAHSATLAVGIAGNPRDGLVSGLDARDYQLAFDPSAAYVLTTPVQPDDQLDWNKLPGLSDCGTFDLAADGVMFGWRFRPDMSPARLEITAYANDAGVHLTPSAPLLTLDADDLASKSPLRYRLAMDGAVYRFAISGIVRGRVVDVAATLPRRCATTAPSTLLVQWAAGLYFGGTSTAPSTITAAIFEQL